MRLWRAVAYAGAFLAACGGAAGSPDGSPGDGAVGVDARPGGCAGAADGTECGDGMICVAGACAASECGDGIVDLRAEECDDANDVAFDGCEEGCAYTCDADAVCDDARACNGAETCDPGSHACASGARADDGTPCAEGSLESGVCRAGACVAPGCGNRIVETGEECDDGNAIASDGCENDCSFSCTEDVDCRDANPCNGAETCDETNPAAPVCAAGTPFDCVPSDACHSALCDPAAADPSAPCVESRVDADSDGESPSTLGACGTDCNDANGAVSSGAVEICGNSIDDDCNSATIDTATTTYYVDCDVDGYAFDATGAVTACEVPLTRPCPSDTGGWTARIPSGTANIDCDNFNAEVRPDQTSYFTLSYTPSTGGGSSYDYNCSAAAERQYGSTAGSTCALTGCPRLPCTIGEVYCGGSSGWAGTVPACGAGGSYSTCARTPRTCRWDSTRQTGCELLCDPRSRDCCAPGTSGCDVDDPFLRDRFCRPGMSGCAISCTPNTFGCTWVYIGCGFTSSSRTQACR